jgi:hypothetical protein
MSFSLLAPGDQERNTLLGVKFHGQPLGAAREMLNAHSTGAPVQEAPRYVSGLRRAPRR